MTDNQNKPTQSENDAASSMHVDIDHFSVTGHVVIAGRDGNISVTTGGDVDTNNETTMMVGGVETTRTEYDQLMGILKQLDEAIVNADLDEDTREEAELEQETLKKQLTRERRLNPKLLTRAAHRLYKMSPQIAGAVVSVFSHPLVGQMVTLAGGIAQDFLESLAKVNNKKGTP